MAIFLNWRTSAPGSVDRITSDLFSSLSSRWYPVNVIRSTVYDILSMYATEFASASAEIQQTFDDLGISTVRTSAIGTQTSSKMYDNFGALFGISKLFTQDYDYFSTASVLQSYRQQLRLLTDGYLAGTSVQGLDRVGQAFTGMAPIVTEPAVVYPGWSLTTYSGSVVNTGYGFILTDQYIPKLGFNLPTGSTHGFVAGGGYVLSYSKLGINTFVRSAEFQHSGLDVYIYSASASVVNTSFQSSIQKAVKAVVRADQDPRLFYSTDYVYYRPQTGSVSTVVDSVYTLSADGYAYNAAPTGRTGASFTGNALHVVPINATSLYGTYFDISLFDGSKSKFDSDLWGTYYNDYFYDWIVLTRNDAYYTMSIRTYPSASIPSTVYYRDYNTNPIPLLSSLSSGAVTSATIAHWTFEDPKAIWDTPTGAYNLYPVAGSSSVPALIFGRNEERMGYQSTGNGFVYTKPLTSIQSIDTSFAIEMWIKGIDTLRSGSLHDIGIRHAATVDYAGHLSSNGYMFKIDGQTQQLVFSIQNATQQSFSASVASYFNEAPERYHYFAMTYVSSSVYLYVDDQVLLSKASGSTAVPGVGTAYLTLFASGTGNTFASGSGVGIDEATYSSGFLTPEMAKSRFEATKPRILRLGVKGEEASGWHQAKLMAWASGANEIEFHEFSIRGVSDRHLYTMNRKLVDILRLPLYAYQSYVSGSVVGFIS